MDIREKTINNIRALAAEAVQKASSGHPGAPMGMAPMAYSLFADVMKHDPADPRWPDRDRFVLSSGHASALLYTLLHLFGYGVTMEDLKSFRQLESKCPGHPEYGHTVGVETTTGPLGQGVANAVGFAIAETMLAARFNREGFPIIDHKTYAICGDGCMMEGISSEACSLAGTLKLDKLTLLYDDNEISIEGDTDIAFRENVGARFESYGWRVLRVKNGNDPAQILDALNTPSDGRPTLIICPTVIGFGCEKKQGTASAHGEPLGEDNLRDTKRALGMPDAPFAVLPEVYAHLKQRAAVGAAKRRAWGEMMTRYADAYPELYAQFETALSGRLPENLLTNPALWDFPAKEATRNTSGLMINRLAALLPTLVGGSADLAPSTKTYIKDGGDYSADNRLGRNLHFGVREHAMGAICNAIAIHGGLRVFCGTFFVFSDYMKHAMRMSAMMRAPVTYVLTHDSIGVGEDGATHQPIEQLAGLRSIPGMTVFRPADGKETCAGWLTALTCGGPVALILSRQGLPALEKSGSDAFRGGYIALDSDKETPDAILMGSGSEVEPLMKAREILKDQGVDARVVSMPSMELFLRQTKAYRDSVLPPAVRARVAMEAAVTMPWYRFTGLDGAVVGIDRFGASAPAAKLFPYFGITAENAAETVMKVLGK